MNLLIDGHTSMDFWRLVYPTSRVLDPGRAVVPKGACATRAEDVWRLAPQWLTHEYIGNGAQKLGVLELEGDHARRRSKTHVARFWKGPLPRGAFYPLGNDVFVSSPCFAFLQMARVLEMRELVAYGDELCGKYAFDRSSERGMRKRERPLITKDQLASFLRSAEGLPGQQKSLAALPYIVKRSASPMETLDEMLLCLPFRRGGYSLRVPTMNAGVPLPPDIARLAGIRDCYTDISWPPLKLDVEHQGKYDHSGSESYDEDRARINALLLLGYEVIELTAGQVGDWAKFETLALYISKKLGHRVPLENRGETPERRKLRDLIFGWNARYGHPEC